MFHLGFTVADGYANTVDVNVPKVNIVYFRTMVYCCSYSEKNYVYN